MQRMDGLWLAEHLTGSNTASSSSRSLQQFLLQKEKQQEISHMFYRLFTIIEEVMIPRRDAQITELLSANSVLQREIFSQK